MCTADRPCTSTGASFPAAPTSASSQPSGLRPMGSPDALPSSLGKRLLLSFNPLSGYRSGLQYRLAPTPTMPFADFFLAVRADHSTLSQFLPHAESQGARKTSRGKTQNVPRVDAEFIKHTPTGRWRTSRSRARSSRVYHTSDPVRIPRPALLDWASFRPHLTMTPLPFS